MQLDVEVSPPSFGWFYEPLCSTWAHYNHRHTECHSVTYCILIWIIGPVTFGQVIAFWQSQWLLVQWLLVKSLPFGLLVKPMTFGPVTFGQVWISVKSDFWSSHRQKVMHKSPPCIRTGELNKMDQSKDTLTWHASLCWKGQQLSVIMWRIIRFKWKSYLFNMILHSNMYFNAVTAFGLSTES